MADSTSVYDRLRTLGITLPSVATPAAAYVPFVRTGNLVFLSGHVAKKDGKAWVGQLGATMGTDEGKAAARTIGCQDVVVRARSPATASTGRTTSPNCGLTSVASIARPPASPNRPPASAARAAR